MRFLPRFGSNGDSAEEAEQACVPKNAEEAVVTGDCASAVEPHLLRTVGWISAALGAVALGLIIGRELRERYKFNRQTPYDFYAHSGDELPDVDCGVGI